MSFSAAAYHVLYRLVRSDRVHLGRPFFSVVVDCGSTGTRVNVYKWEMRAGGSGGSKQLPVLLHSYPDNTTKGWKSGCRYHCIQTEPGLDKFMGNLSGIRASLDPLIHWAEDVVPHERHHETPILVLATAGLRSFPAKDEECILDDVGRVIKDHRFAYNRTSWIRVLSGKQEAYYGWVALNYKMRILQSSSQRGNTLGLADLGGSSLQLVMEVDRIKDDDDDRILRSDLGGRRNELLAVSIPQFGLNEAYDRSVAMLSAETQGREIWHPCLGSTFVQNHTRSNCLVEQSSKSSRLLHVVGDPNMELCLRLVKAVALNASMTALGIPIKPVSSLRFHALSGFFVVYNMLDLPERAKMTEMWSKAQKLCSRLWTLEESLQPDCFKAMYMVSLIRDALCFLHSSEIVFGPGDVSWALGASLVEHQYYYYSLNAETADTLSGILLSIKYDKVLLSPVLLFIVLLLVLCVVYRCQVKLPMTQRRRPGLALASAPPPVLPSHNHFNKRPQ
ncbi:hypothetical protein V2J09_000746 [Rumex salicifolius]